MSGGKITGSNLVQISQINSKYKLDYISRFQHYYDATPFTFQWEGNGKFPGRILASADGGGANGRPCTRGQ